MLAILPSIIPVAACWSNCQVFFPLLHVGHTAKYCSRCCMLVTLPSIVPIAACWSHCYVFFPLLHVGHTAKYCSHCCMLVTLPQVFHSFAWSVILWILASDKISGSWQFISFFFFLQYDTVLSVSSPHRCCSCMTSDYELLLPGNERTDRVSCADFFCFTS